MGIIVEVTPTIDTAAYATGDHLGTLHTIDGVNAGGGGHMTKLSGLVIVDKSAQKSALDIFIFDAAPTITSLDNAAANISDAEMADKCIGHVVVAAADYRDLSANSTASLRSLGMHLKPEKASSEGKLYAFVVCRGSPTYGAATDLVFKYIFDWR